MARENAGFVTLQSRAGREFPGVYELLNTGELSLMTDPDDGYKSAHRDYATRALGGSVLRVIHHQFRNSRGEVKVVTVWRRKP